MNNNKNYKWQLRGYDNGYQIDQDTIWRDLPNYQSTSCESAYLNNIEKISTNGGEYQFNVRNQEMYVIDLAFCSPIIPIRRIQTPS